MRNSGGWRRFPPEGPGLLVHPVWPAEQAFFVELTAEEEPLPDYVRYRFAFWEDWEGYSGALTENDDGGTAPWQGGGTAAGEGARVHVVKKGDTLWGSGSGMACPWRSCWRPTRRSKIPTASIRGTGWSCHDGTDIHLRPPCVRPAKARGVDRGPHRQRALRLV